MTIVTVEEAESQIAELLARVSQGEEIGIVENGQVVAKISPTKPKRQRPGFGIDAGKITIAPDFDDPLPEFDL